MKILFIDTLYRSVVDQLGHSLLPGEGDDFSRLNDSLGNQFGTGASYVRELIALGHDASVIYANSPKSQMAWSREVGIGGFRFIKPMWDYWQIVSRIPLVGRIIHENSALVKILMAQIARLNPDVVYLLNINLLNNKLIKTIQSKGIVVVGQIASPLPPKYFYTGYDHIFSAHPGQVKRFKNLGISSSWLPLAFDAQHTKTLSNVSKSERYRDVTFVGTFGRHQKSTVPLMKALAKAIPTLEIYSFASARYMKRLGLENNFKGAAWGDKMYDIFSKSKIVINRHGAVAEGYSVNFRLFEGTGMGAIVLTEEGRNLADLFEPGTEILTYRSIPEAVEKAREVLANFDKFQSIGTRGQNRTLTDHTYKNRARSMENVLVGLLSNP